MSPPELPGNAPIADVFHPLRVFGTPIFGDEAESPVAVGLERRRRERLHPDEPLIGESRLNHGVAAVAVADGVPMIFNPLDQSQRVEFRDHSLAGFIAVQTTEPLRDAVVHAGIVGHHVELLEAVPFADLEIHGIVRRGDLDRTGAEGGVHRRVADDANGPAHQREQGEAADQIAVARVVGVHRDAGVPEDGLRAGGGDGQVPATLQWIPQVPELAVDLDLLDFFIRERGEAAGAPVDDVLPAIDQPFLEQGDEDHPHGAREIGIEGVVGAVPVAAAADGPQLLEDDRAGLGHILADPCLEGLPAQIESGLPLTGQQLFDHVLGRDAGVVGAGKPEGIPAPHPLKSHHDVLDGVVEPMAHVQLGGDVGRGHHHDVGAGRSAGTGIGTGPEEVAPLPAGVEILLQAPRIVLWGKRPVGHAERGVSSSTSDTVASSSPCTRIRLMTVTLGPAACCATR